MRINTLVLLAVAFVSHSAIYASANQISSNLSLCEGLECQKDNKVITRRLRKRQDPPPGDGSEISESFPSTIDTSNSFEPSITSPTEPIDTNSSNNTPTSVSFPLTPTTDSVAPSVVPSVSPTEVPSSNPEVPSPSISPTEVPPTTPPSSSPPPPPTSETPLPSPTSETPLPSPTSETPLPSPTSETPPPSPTSETPLPSPTSETPLPSPTSETPLPSPTSETPLPSPTSETPSPSPTSETPLTTPSATPTGISSDANPSPSNSVPNPKPTDEKKESSNTGAIVGGVVGGIAVIAAIAGFIGYRYYQKKKQFSNVNFDFDDIAMSSPPPTAGSSGGSRLNAMSSTPATFPRNDVGAGAAIGAGLAAGSIARQQDSHYRPPSPNEYHSTSRQRQEYTNSQVSSQPSFASTDAFVDKNQRNQYSPERPPNNVAPTAPLNQFYNSDSPRSQRSNVDPPYNDFNQTQQVHRSESIPPMGRIQRNQDFNEFNASPAPVRQDNNRLAPDLARDNTFRSSVTSSSAGPGINEADLEETVIVGFGGGQVNRSNSSLSNHSSERNLTHGLNTGPDLPLFTMTAIEPYMPERPNELLVQPDDELIITEEVGDQWFIGYNRSRNPEVKGYFPRNCVVGGYY